MVRSTSFDTLTHRFFKANSFSNTSDVLSSLTFMMAQNCSEVPASSSRKPNERHKELLEALISVDLLIDGTHRQPNLELSILFFRTSTGTACVHLDVHRVVHHNATRLRKALPIQLRGYRVLFVVLVWCLPDFVDVEVDTFHLFFLSKQLKTSVIFVTARIEGFGRRWNSFNTFLAFTGSTVGGILSLGFPWITSPSGTQPNDAKPDDFRSIYET